MVQQPLGEGLDAMSNTLYFGDNLDILREYVKDQSVDLVYLDPPFNSQAQYNVLFQSPADEAASAQVEAFRDMWAWGDEAEWAFAETMKRGGGAARFIDALRSALGNSDMMAYLVMMAVRLEALRSTLRPSGSLYLHCDTTASHYLKIILDGIFGPDRFQSEVIWKRTFSHGGARRYGPVHDVILFFSRSRSPEFTWNNLRVPHDPEYIDKHFRLVEPITGRRFQAITLTGSGVRGGASGQPWRDVNPSDVGRHWALPREILAEIGVTDGSTQDRLDALDKAGRIHWPDKEGGTPRLKWFEDDLDGVAISDVWTDISPVTAQARERLGYPTQKPLALMQRIVEASSRPGHVILDPFCGCGTTIEAAQRDGREWIGIDVALHAIKVIEARLEQLEGVADYKVEGIPRDFESAKRLAERDKYQFQWWANYLFNPHALREQKKGADKGIDGELFFPNGPGRPWGRMLTSVKGGANVGVSMVREFRAVLEREKAEMGLFICLRAPTKAMRVEATAAGFADTVHDGLPKLQIVSIEEWFEDKFPKLPPLEHLPSAAFATTRRRRPAKRARPDPRQPEFPYTFVGEKKTGSVVHFNPLMVGADAREQASS